MEQIQETKSWFERIANHKWYDMGAAAVFGCMALLEAWAEMYGVAMIMAFISGMAVGVGMWKPLALECLETSKDLIETLKKLRR